MKQKIMLVRFVSNVDGVHAQFWPLMDTSQLKELEDKMKASVGKFAKPLLDFDIKKVMQIKNLEAMNNDGWELQNILEISDERRLKFQVAIFKKETKDESWIEYGQDGEVVDVHNVVDGQEIIDESPKE